MKKQNQMKPNKKENKTKLIEWRPLKPNKTKQNQTK